MYTMWTVHCLSALVSWTHLCVPYLSLCCLLMCTLYNVSTIAYIFVLMILIYCILYNYNII